MFEKQQQRLFSTAVFKYQQQLQLINNSLPPLLCALIVGGRRAFGSQLTANSVGRVCRYGTLFCYRSIRLKICVRSAQQPNANIHRRQHGRRSSSAQRSSMGVSIYQRCAVVAHTYRSFEHSLIKLRSTDVSAGRRSNTDSSHKVPRVIEFVGHQQAPTIVINNKRVVLTRFFNLIQIHF